MSAKWSRKQKKKTTIDIDSNIGYVNLGVSSIEVKNWEIYEEYMTTMLRIYDNYIW